MKNYFSEFQTSAEIKREYYRLARAYHPDLGGDAEIMKAINAQYENAMRFAFSDEFADFSDDYKTRAGDSIVILREAIEFAVTLPAEISIKICGFWLWLEGETYPHKERIKSFQSADGKKFRFSHNKCAPVSPESTAAAETVISRCRKSKNFGDGLMSRIRAKSQVKSIDNFGFLT